VNYLITHFGAVADVSSNAAASIQKAIDAAHEAGGGTVVVPAGQSFLCGSIVLKSFVRLHLEPGATLKASGNIDDYINYEHLDLFSQSDFCRFWIFAKDSCQITIDGSGTLDGNSSAYVAARLESHSVAKSPRAQTLVFLGCQDITVRDIHIIKTPSWALRPAGCDRVLIEGVCILNDLSLVNTDGIDIDCSRSVRIANCHVEAGDDAISIKGRREIAAQYGPCEDITITGCVLESHCCAFRLGCESHVDFRRIVFSSSTIRRSHRGIALDCRDEALIEDILITDLTIETIHSHRIWWHEGEPIWICQVPYVSGHYGENSKVARFRNIVFRNINITSEQGIYVQGANDEAHPSDILLDNIRIHLRKRTPHPVGFADPRPNRPGFMIAGHKGIEEETPWGSLFKHDVPAFFLDRVENITLRNCRVTWADQMPAAYSHALEAWAVRKVVLENFHGKAAREELMPLLLDGVPRPISATEVLNS
jgi:polygalacturonase